MTRRRRSAPGRSRNTCCRSSLLPPSDWPIALPFASPRRLRHLHGYARPRCNRTSGWMFINFKSVSGCLPPWAISYIPIERPHTRRFYRNQPLNLIGRRVGPRGAPRQVRRGQARGDRQRAGIPDPHHQEGARRGDDVAGERPHHAGHHRRHRALRRPVRHGVGRLSRPGGDRHERLGHARQGRGPGRRGADHDRHRPGRRPAGGHGLQLADPLQPRADRQARRLRLRAFDLPVDGPRPAGLGTRGQARQRAAGRRQLLAGRTIMAFGSFDRKTSSQPMAEINMVPLIDVVLVLLVIFIVTAPLLTNAVKLDLPKATSTADIQKPEKVEFAIDATGSLFWNGERLSREDAVASFVEAGAQRPQPEIYLRADQNVAYRYVAEMLADASKAGLSKIAFVSEPAR